MMTMAWLHIEWLSSVKVLSLRNRIVPTHQSPSTSDPPRGSSEASQVPLVGDVEAPSDNAGVGDAVQGDSERFHVHSEVARSEDSFGPGILDGLPDLGKDTPVCDSIELATAGRWQGLNWVPWACKLPPQTGIGDLSKPGRCLAGSKVAVIGDSQAAHFAKPFMRYLNCEDLSTAPRRGRFQNCKVIKKDKNGVKRKIKVKGGPIPYFGKWEGAQWGCARCSGCGLGEHRCSNDLQLEALTVEYVDWKAVYVPPWSNTTQEFLFRQYWNDTKAVKAPGALKTFKSRAPSLVWANTGLHEPRVITFEKNATDALEYGAGTARYMREALRGGRQLIWSLTTAVKRGDQPKDWKDVTSSYRIWLLNQHARHAAQQVLNDSDVLVGTSGIALFDAFGTSRAPGYSFHSDGVHMENHGNVYYDKMVALALAQYDRQKCRVSSSARSKELPLFARAPYWSIGLPWYPENRTYCSSMEPASSGRWMDDGAWGPWGCKLYDYSEGEDPCQGSVVYLVGIKGQEILDALLSALPSAKNVSLDTALEGRPDVVFMGLPHSKFAKGKTSAELLDAFKQRVSAIHSGAVKIVISDSYPKKSHGSSWLYNEHLRAASYHASVGFVDLFSMGFEATLNLQETSVRPEMVPAAVGRVVQSVMKHSKCRPRIGVVDSWRP
ncbi:hypothetical protein FOZ62_017050 [Perkinsus olseni]|uniref:Uncharacterized protein n=1 Tax=Perkinsus olseni TaxID=32597 RepID=A0A7J6RD31_PEROL|nr:hypothetical protein FOZ62_017050 [Perkinsus olseni]